MHGTFLCSVRAKLNFEDVGLSGTLIASAHHDLYLKFNKGQIISRPTLGSTRVEEIFVGSCRCFLFNSTGKTLFQNEKL